MGFRKSISLGGRNHATERSNEVKQFDLVKARQLTKAKYETLAEIRFVLRKFLSFSEAAAKAVGLSPQQHQALLAIKGFPQG